MEATCPVHGLAGGGALDPVPLPAKLTKLLLETVSVDLQQEAADKAMAEAEKHAANAAANKQE